MFYVFSSYGFGRRLMFARVEQSATAEGENCAYGPTLQGIPQKVLQKFLYFSQWSFKATNKIEKPIRQYILPRQALPTKSYREI